MLNLCAIENAKLQHSPYTFAIIDGVLSKESAQSLLINRPEDNNYLSTRQSGSDKTYQVVNNILVPIGTNTIRLRAENTEWLSLVTALMSIEYKNSLSNLLKTQLQDAYQEITFKHYREGDYISAHTDRDIVRATHLLFFNDIWEDAWGGMLHIMNNAHDSFLAIPPLWNQSVAFLQSSNSWHSVSPCVNKLATRYALQITFKDVLEVESPPGRDELLITI